jgi:hypothetical protein
MNEKLENGYHSQDASTQRKIRLYGCVHASRADRMQWGWRYLPL